VGAPLGIRLNSREQLTQACIRAVRQVTGNTQIGFNAESVYGSTTLSLVGPNHTNAQASRSYKVVPFCQFSIRKYWLAILLELEYYMGEPYLMSVSLVVFEGIDADDYKTPILRAEWASPSGADRAPHAQPHWHIYTPLPPPGHSTVLGAGSDSLLGAVALSPSLERFHFAMASHWHCGGAAPQVHHLTSIDHRGFADWLQGCLEYVRGQLAYINP
jgi:hypothetical protein